MWTPIAIEGELYMIKSKENNKQLTIGFTDLTEVYEEVILEKEAETKFKMTNPHIDIDNVFLKITTLVKNITTDSNERSIRKEDGFVVIIVSFKINKFNAMFEFTLKQLSSKKVMETLIAPLLLSVKYLKDQQDYLCLMLQNKDRELAQYKMEKGDISRNDLVTEKFDKDVINLKTKNLLVNIFDKNEELWEKLLEPFQESSERTTSEVNTVYSSKKRKIYSSKTASKSGILYKKE